MAKLITHTQLCFREIQKLATPAPDRIGSILFFFHEIEVEAEKEEDGSMGGEE